MPARLCGSRQCRRRHNESFCNPVQLIMRAMDRKARECEAASVLLAALHPKLIDPQQV